MGSSRQKLAITTVVLATILVAYFLNPQFALNSAKQSGQSKQTKIIKLWPGDFRAGKLDVGPEKDMTKATDDLIAGNRIIRLGNVSDPELHLFLPPIHRRNGTSVLVCPGGGFSILAWDLEGTEVATWLNSIGITACVLKYRTPTRNEKTPWLMPLQDTQRAISLMRHHANDWGVDERQVGVLGFSAGAVGAMRAGVSTRKYPPLDEVDKRSSKPDFTILIYGGGLLDKSTNQLMSDLKFNSEMPPAFLIHAFDDFVPIENCLRLVEAYKKVNVPVEFHLFREGGHGYGIREIPTVPVTRWTSQCEAWLKGYHWIEEIDEPVDEPKLKRDNE